jgi:hypothetical protein
MADNEIWDIDGTEAVKAATDLKKVIAISKLKKRKRGRPRKTDISKYQKKLELTKADERVLALLCTGMNKNLVADLEGISRRELYRLLDSTRLEKIKANAENRLNALMELAIMVIHKALLNGDSQVAMTVAKGLGLLKQNKANEGSKKYKTTLERILERDGKETQRIIKEQAEEPSAESDD